MTTPKDIFILKQIWEQNLVSHTLLDAPLKTFYKELMNGKKVSLGDVLVRLGVISPRQLQTLEENSQKFLREIAPEQFVSIPLNINSQQCTELEKVGESALGNTYKAQHPKINECTIKYIEGILAINRKFLKRFFSRIEKLVGLSHKNIATVYHASHDKLEIIREFIPGENLCEYLEEESVSIKKACHIILCAARGLHFAHQNGTLHKNLKPTNIIVTPDDNVKVVDFALPPTLPSYLSPEQCKKQKSDERSDIYSLGLIFYYLITEKQAVQANSNKEIMEKLIASDFSINEIANLPENVFSILEKMLAKEANKRYANYSDLIEDLENTGTRTLISAEVMNDLMHTAEIALSVDEKQDLLLNGAIEAPYGKDDIMTLEAEEVDEDKGEEPLSAVEVKSEEFFDENEITISNRSLPEFDIEKIKNQPELKTFDLDDKEDDVVDDNASRGSLLKVSNKIKPYFLKNVQKKAKENRDQKE